MLSDDDWMNVFKVLWWGCCFGVLPSQPANPRLLEFPIHEES